MQKTFTDGIFKYREQVHNLNELEIYGVVDEENLTTINIPDYYNLKPITAISDKAFTKCANLEVVRLGNNIESIGNYAFANCRKLKEIHHKTLYMAIKLKFRAFIGCRSLRVVDMNIGYIGAAAFQNCVNLEEIYISGMCSVVEDYAFDGCCGLSKVTFLPSIHAPLEIHPMAFHGGRIEELHIDRTVKYNDKNIMLSRPFEDYFHPATKIYCPIWSNLTDLCFVGREVIIEEICV